VCWGVGGPGGVERCSSLAMTFVGGRGGGWCGDAGGGGGVGAGTRGDVSGGTACVVSVCAGGGTAFGSLVCWVLIFCWGYVLGGRGLQWGHCFLFCFFSVVRSVSAGGFACGSGLFGVLPVWGLCFFIRGLL